MEQLLTSLPRRVKVGAYDYRIELAPKLPDEDGGRTWGFCDPNNYILHFFDLHEAPSPEWLIGTVLHEILHAVWDERGIGKRPDEEKAVSKLEVGLLNFMRDNPKMMNWMKKGLK